ncbi:MAG: MopE-related protein [Pseudomonadota bacterium]
MRALSLVFLALSLAACGEKTDDTGAEPSPEDRDGDGFAEDDCDDDDPAIHPGADERCNGVDDDCDEVVDDDAVDAPTWYADVDEDGYGDPALALAACEAPSGYVADATDCDDARDDVHPGAPEDDCADPTDYNCDGSVMHADADEDGVAACEDCDDEDPERSPLLPEVCDAEDVDEDCDGLADDDDPDVEGQAIWYTDTDGDGFGDPATAQAACDASARQVAVGEDCDDAIAAVNPDAAETCLTTYDDDCDGVADAVGATGCATWYYDGDRDGFGLATASQCTCAASGSYDATDASDCDDALAAVNPGATESCLTVYDDDCDGSTEALDATGCTTWYYDGDRDFYGLDTSSQCLCAATGLYDATHGGDCDDANAAVSPAASDSCLTPYDDDCDGVLDSGASIGCTDWYYDGDRDGFGLATSYVCRCEATGSWNTADATDCDDTRAAVNPGATETCATAYDDDCDGATDAIGATGCSTWYYDGDRDGFGLATASQCTCAASGSYDASVATDCDDVRATVNPAATESCATAYDDDCDGATDAIGATGCSTWYLDGDRDGYGLATSSQCRCAASGSYDASTGTDCDDSRASVHPGATETCTTAFDDDCDGVADALGATGCSTWYYDGDGDSYGVSTSSQCRCAASGSYDATIATDCDDTRAAVNPGATEACATAYDDDCDGATDAVGATGCATWYYDGDRDGYGLGSSSQCTCLSSGSFDVLDATDCDDTRAAVNPGATEACATTWDDDCDGATDAVGATGCATWYLDGDRDGYGLASDSQCTCAAQDDYDVTDATDCDDTYDTVNPDAEEVCDGLDNDCDLIVDPGCPTYGYSGDYQAEGSTSVCDADGTIYAGTSNDYFGRHLAVGYDFNGDGVSDLAAAAYGYTYAAPWGTSYRGGVFAFSGFPAGATLSSAYDGLIYGTTPSTSTGEFGLGLWGLEDFDADGHDEIAVYERQGSSTYYIWLVEGASLMGGGMVSSYAVDRHGFTGTGPVVGLGEASVTAGVHPIAVGYTSYSSSTGEVRLLEASGGSAIATWNLYGESSNDLAGSGLAGGVGNDVNGDGYDDLFIGAPGDDDAFSGAGAVYVVESPVGSSYTLSAAPLKLLGASSSDQLGYRLSAPGDVDGDGYADLLAGAPAADDGATEAGVVYLFNDVNPDDSSHAATAADATATIVGEGGYDRIGMYGMEMGDMNGDGELDLAVGAPMSSAGGAAGAGAVWLLYGPLAGTYDLSDAADYDARFLGDGLSDDCGTDLGFGDYDGDGQADLVMGCTDGDHGGFIDVGTVYLFLGM